MDLAASYPAAFDGDQRQRRKRIALGVAVSLALHALLLSAYRSGLTRPALDETPAPSTIAVWLRPPAPVAPPLPAQAAPPLRAHARRESGPVRKRGRRIIAVAPAAPAPAQVQQQAVEAVAGKAVPHFDMEAARRVARGLAHQRDPSRIGTAVGQFPEKPLQTESRAARAISSAYRPYCKDGVPGGLLAPIYLMLDKKDSGCRW